MWTGEGWLFVAVVLDLYSRRVVGWSMQPTMTAQSVMDALLMAIFRRGRPRAVLHHSDQGSQYTSEDFQRLLESHGIVCSMSRRGNCWDNAAMKSFLSKLKTKRLSKSTTGPEMIYALTCSTTSKGSTIHAGVIPPSDISARYSFKT